MGQTLRGEVRRFPPARPLFGDRVGTDQWLSWSLGLLFALTLWGMYAQIRQGAAWRKQIQDVQLHARSQRLRRFGVHELHEAATAPPAANSGLGVIWAFFSRLRPRGRALTPSELSLMALEVSSRLRAGGGMAAAWEQTWKRNSDGPFEGIEVSGAPKNLVGKHTETQSRLRPANWWRVVAAGRRSDLAESGAGSIVAACRFSYLSGAPMADVLEQVAEGLVQATRGRDAQDRAFAGPRLAARVLTSLPFLAVAATALLGLGPIAWFLGGGIGTAALLGGLTLSAAGHMVSQGMIARARERTKDKMEATILCDLAAAGLAAGAAIPAVLKSLGRARADAEWVRISEELVMGSPWNEAWDPEPAGAHLLRQGLQVGWEEGVSPLSLLAHLSKETRERHVAAAEDEAARLGVKLVIPLGLFLLPAFVLLGLLPAIFALIGGQSLL